MVGASSRDIRLEASLNVESTVAYAVPDYHKMAPSYYGADIMNVSDEEFTAVLGHEIPPSVRDKSQPLNYLNTIEDAKDGKWGGRLYRMLLKMLGEETMMGAVAVQTPIKNFISMSFGIFSPKMADGLLLILDEDKFWRGLGKIIGGFLFGGGIKKLGRLKQI